MKAEHIFDNPGRVKKMIMGFYGFLGLLLVIDLILPKHPFFPWENYPFFYAAYGFVAYVVIVFGSNYVLRKFLKRKEDYYD
jgi:hypothetical protein